MNIRPGYDTLRIALTQEGLRPDALLPFEQIRSIAKAAVDCGVRRFDLSGGEPLVREDIPLLVMMLSSLTVLEDMTLTTDGILLPRWAKALRGAGIRRVTVKLDTFDPSKYRAMTGGGDLTAVLTGIRTLMEVGFPPATIQARLIRGVNGDELPSLLRLTSLTGVSLRLMEMTPEEAAAFGPDAHMACSEALERMPGLECAEAASHVYRLPDAAGAVTLVPCEQREAGCIVLTADGMLRAGPSSIHARHLSEAELGAYMKTLIP